MLKAEDKLARLLFFQAPDHPCSYLEDYQARMLFADPNAEVDTEMYTLLSRIGFRRSGSHLYRPQCAGCNACIPVRIPVALFTPDRRQQRILKKNADITTRWLKPVYSEEYYRLFEGYIAQRHQDGDMYPADPEQFESMFITSRPECHFLELRLGQQLVAVAAVDLLLDGLSAIYTFYEPALSKRSLGTLAVLLQIQTAARLEAPYVYLGYWISECRKMAYKSEYQPLEIYQQGKWHLLQEL